MSVIGALRWSRPFQARMTGTCSLCCRDIFQGEEISILATIETNAGTTTIVGHLKCTHLDTPSWRISQFQPAATVYDLAASADLAAATDELAFLQERVGLLEEQLARKSDVCERLRERLQQLRAAIQVVES